MAGGGLGAGTRVIQVTNIAPQATKDQMQSLFSNIGKIEEIRLYPTVRDVSCPVQSRICYIKFSECSCVLVAQHLTNTVFIDRALIVIPVADIPEEYRALEMSKNGTIVPGLHKPDSKLPPEVVNRIEGHSPQQVIKTYDPKLVDNNLPEYPALPSYYDSRKIEEIRRTIIVCDVKNEWRLDDLMDYFARAGEVKYARWAEKNSRTYCMIEFCEQYSVINALKMQGHNFKNGKLNIYHSTDSINKPEAKSNEAAQREIEEAMKIVKEAQYMISAAIDPVIGMLAKDKRRRSRSRSRSREHRRSRSKSRQSSRSRRRSHSRTRSKRSRSKESSSRKRSSSRTKRSRSLRKSRSESRSKRTKSRDRNKRSRSRRRRSSSKGSQVNRSKSKQPKRSHSKDQKRSNRKEEKGQRSRSRSKHSRSQSSRNKESKKTYHPSKHRAGSADNRKMKKLIDEPFARDYDAEEKLGQSSHQDDKHRKSSSVGKSDNMDISNSP